MNLCPLGQSQAVASLALARAQKQMVPRFGASAKVASLWPRVLFL